MFYQCLILQGTYLHLFSDHLVISTGSQDVNDLWNYNSAIILLQLETVSLCKNKLFLLISQILESSQTLLDVLKGEIGNGGKASEPQSTSKEKEKQAHGQKHS
uniref:Uncharacterized protein n=1 Tax=Accipiter nisus TaxID=211598 RepID=A0A8B9NA68_9AVES